MRMVRGVLIVFAVLAVAVGCSGRVGLFAGTSPGDLGVRGGKLKAPSKTDNSVSSQANLYPENLQSKAAQIAPLALRGSGPATLARIKTVVEGMDGARVVKSDSDYLYAQYTSKVMGFVDDVEFWYDPAASVVQVRSASRIGSGDLGVNRKRIEEVRARLAALP
ncbi:MAG: DUF1499 domain-containing protein [Burkholderiaceae bacterium]